MIKLSFLGAAGNVTGSQYLLETGTTRFLVDCGLYQERDFRNRNWEPFRFSPGSVDAVLLTHAHLDHCGLLPKLVRDGFRGRIYCTEATAEIARIILMDSAKLQEEDAEFKRRRHQREGRRGPFPEVPLYTIDDARAVFPLFSRLRYQEPVHLGDDIEVTFHDAGHVLGSSMIKIKVNCNGESRTLVFSGDIGRWDRPMLEDPSTFTKVDYIVVESTYGDREHEESPDVSDCLAEVINSTRQSGGNIVVPSFALQRAQEILYRLNELLIDDRIPHLMVFLDSPMASSITEVFKRHTELFDQEMKSLLRHHRSPFEFPGFRVVETVDESKSLNHIAGTVMIIAGSGMCTGGRIKHHLVNNISRRESTILFVGYQAAGTLGRSILNGARRVRILGQQYPVRARIARIHGLSSHADRNELDRWLSGYRMAPRRLFVTHGESGTARRFARQVKENTGWEVLAPEYGKEVTLD